MTKRMFIMLILVAVVFGGVFGFKAWTGYMMGKKMAARGMPPQTVSTLQAGYQEWQPKLEAVGSLRAVRGVDISPEVPGIVARIHFKQGQDVKKGTLLLELDASSDTARLQSLKAAAELARITYRRDLAQFRVKAVSKQTVDTDEANLKQAIANAAEQQAMVNKKFIHAPFSGRLGIRQVDIGQYLKTGTAVVTLQALEPIYLDFFLPQQVLNAIKVGQKVIARTNTWPDRMFRGSISVVNPQVESSTRNVRVRATLENRDHSLLPGMYVTVNIVSGLSQRYITLPQTAITYNPYGNMVYLAEKKGEDKEGRPQRTARSVFVTTGAERGDQVAIIKGIKEGDIVITAGQMKLRNGSPILVNNAIQPSFDANPQPEDQ